MITYDQDFIWIQTNNIGVSGVLKQSFHAPLLKGGYRLPKTLWVMRELANSLPELKADEAFMAQGKKLRLGYDQLLNARKVAAVNYPDLRKYQNQDVGYLSHLQHAGIFNEPRTGKTATLIKLLDNKGLWRNLIVAPASLMYNWEAEFKKFDPMMDVIVADGKPKARQDAYISGKTVIVSKSTLASDIKLMNSVTWDACVVDEAHFLRNYDTKQSKAIYAVKANHRYALTGTPTINGADDIYGILKFLYPKKYPSYWQFVDRYFPVFDMPWGGKEIGKPYLFRENELQEMTGLMSVQRTRKEVMPWLPAKTFTIIEIKMGDKQTKLYRDMAKTFSAIAENGVVADAQNVISQMMRLRQICQDPKLLDLDAPSAKTDALMEYVSGHNEPLVVMSWFTSYLKQLEPLLTAAGRKVGFIHGELSAIQKQSAAKDFQEGRIDLLLCNIISAGTGFTLNRSNTVIFLDRAFTPSENDQAEDRVCPTMEGANLKHEIVTIVCKDSIDQHIHDIVERKESLTDIINKGGAQAIRRLLGYG